VEAKDTSRQNLLWLKHYSVMSKTRDIDSLYNFKIIDRIKFVWYEIRHSPKLLIF